MTLFSLIFQLGDDPQTACIIVFAESLAEAKEDALAMFQHCRVDRGYVAIGRGHGDDVEWVGAFTFAPGSEPRWEAGN